MGLKREEASYEIMKDSFAPYMGLKSYHQITILEYLKFAPYMGLKSV